MTTPTPKGAQLQLRELTKTYAGTPAVDQAMIDVSSGEFLTLLGPSGSGKSTTLSMIAGFTDPTAGRVVLDGQEITAIPPHKRGLGMVFQNYSLFPHLSVRENVEFPLRQRGVPKTKRKQQALEALKLVELQERAEAKPSQLSGGQQQRVALARSLVFEPRLLLMDEPFGALDRALRERLQIELRRIHRELGITIIFVTHDQEEALTLSDRIAVFNHGRIEQVGTPHDLYEQPNTLFVARFIGESNALTGSVANETFTSAHGLTFPASGAGDGESVAIIRPERIRIADTPATSPSIKATVTDVTYLGSEHRIECETAEGTIIMRTGIEIPAPHLHDDVVLTWNAQHATLFADSNTQLQGDNHEP